MAPTHSQHANHYTRTHTHTLEQALTVALQEVFVEGVQVRVCLKDAQELSKVSWHCPPGYPAEPHPFPCCRVPGWRLCGRDEVLGEERVCQLRETMGDEAEKVDMLAPEGIHSHHTINDCWQRHATHSTTDFNGLSTHSDSYLSSIALASAISIDRVLRFLVQKVGVAGLILISFYTILSRCKDVLKVCVAGLMYISFYTWKSLKWVWLD